MYICYTMAKKPLAKRFHETDIVRWQKVAKIENRNLTNWMETELNKAAEKVLGADKKLKPKK